MHTLWQEIRDLDVSRKAVRSFGLVVGTVLLGIAGFFLWKSSWTMHPVVLWLGGTGATLIGFGLILPAALRPLYRVWMGLALVLGFVMTRVLLTVVFYLAVVPTGGLLRLFGKDPLERKWGASSYWIAKEYVDDSPQRLEKYY